MRLLWQLHHIFMVLISSKCSDLSGPFSGGEGRRCRSGPCSADSFNCLMVLIHWNKSGILPALIYCRAFFGGGGVQMLALIFLQISILCTNVWNFDLLEKYLSLQCFRESGDLIKYYIY